MNVSGLFLGSFAANDSLPFVRSYLHEIENNNNIALMEKQQIQAAQGHVFVISDKRPAKLVRSLEAANLLFLRQSPIAIKSTQFISDSPSDDIGAIQSAIQVVCKDGSIVSYVINLNQHAVQVPLGNKDKNSLRAADSDDVGYGDLLRVYVDTETPSIIKGLVPKFPNCTAVALSSQLMILGTESSCLFACVNSKRDKAKRPFLSNEDNNANNVAEEKWISIDGSARSPISISTNFDQSLVCIAYSSSVSLYSFRKLIVGANLSLNMESQINLLMEDKYTVVHAKFLMHSSNQFLVVRQKMLDQNHYEIIVSVYLNVTPLIVSQDASVSFSNSKTRFCNNLPYKCSLHPDTHISIKFVVSSPLVDVATYSSIVSSQARIVLATQKELFSLAANTDLFLLDIGKVSDVASEVPNICSILMHIDGGLLVLISSSGSVLCIDHALQKMEVSSKYLLPCGVMISDNDVFDKDHKFVQADWVILPKPLRGVDGDYGINTLAMLFSSGNVLLLHFSIPAPKLTSLLSQSLIAADPDHSLGSSAVSSFQNSQNTDEYGAASNIRNAVMSQNHAGIALKGAVGGTSEFDNKHNNSRIVDFLAGVGFFDPFNASFYSENMLKSSISDETTFSNTGRSRWTASCGGLAATVPCSALSPLATFLLCLNRHQWNEAIEQCRNQLLIRDRQWCLLLFVRLLLSNHQEMDYHVVEMVTIECMAFWGLLHNNAVDSLIESTFAPFTDSRLPSAKIESHTHITWLHHQQRWFRDCTSIVNDVQTVFGTFVIHLLRSKFYKDYANKLLTSLCEVKPSFSEIVSSSLPFDINNIQSSILASKLQDPSLHEGLERSLEESNATIQIGHTDIPQLSSYSLFDPNLLLSSSFDYDTVQSILQSNRLESLSMLPPQLVLSVGKYFESRGQLEEAASLYRVYSTNGGLTNDFEKELNELQTLHQAILLATDI